VRRLRQHEQALHGQRRCSSRCWWRRRARLVTNQQAMSMALAPDVTAPAVPLAHGLTASVATPAISMQTSTTRKIPWGMLIRHVAVRGAYAAWATYVPAPARNTMTSTTATSGFMGPNQTERKPHPLPVWHEVPGARRESSQSIWSARSASELCGRMQPLRLSIAPSRGRLGAPGSSNSDA
jgi:hypothetical protein